LNLMLGIMFGIFSMFGFGVANYLLSIASRSIGALRAAFWYELLAALLLAILALFLFSGTGINTTTVCEILLASLLSATAVLSFSKGVRIGNVEAVTTVSCAYGAVAAVLGFVLLDEKLAPLQMLCIGLIVVGTIVVSFRPRTKGARGRNALGIEYALLAMACWGGWSVLIGLLVKEMGWFTAALLTTVSTPVFLLAYAVLAGEGMAIKRRSLPLIAALAAISAATLIAFNLGLTYSYVDIVTPIAAASPAVTIVLALAFLKDRLSLNQKAGIALIIVSLVALAAA